MGLSYFTKSAPIIATTFSSLEDTSFDSVTPVTTQMTQMMEDQSVALEIVEPSVHSLDMDTEVSVVCGGTKEGWTPVAAVVLWTRMLGVLGNINNIESSSIHAQVLNALSDIWHLLAKVRHLPYHKNFTIMNPVMWHSLICTIANHTVPYITLILYHYTKGHILSCCSITFHSAVFHTKYHTVKRR